MIKNNSSTTQVAVLDTKAILSVLWVFLSLNYIFCDLLSNMEQGTISSLLEGNIAGFPMSQGFLLMAGISLEIPFLMVVISKILPFKPNKYINMIAAVLMIAYQLGSLFIGTEASLHYIFFSTIEVLGNICIFIIAIKWREKGLTV